MPWDSCSSISLDLKQRVIIKSKQTRRRIPTCIDYSAPLRYERKQLVKSDQHQNKARHCLRIMRIIEQKYMWIFITNTLAQKVTPFFGYPLHRWATTFHLCIPPKTFTRPLNQFSCWRQKRRRDILNEKSVQWYISRDGIKGFWLACWRKKIPGFWCRATIRAFIRTGWRKY